MVEHYIVECCCLSCPKAAGSKSRWRGETLPVNSNSGAERLSLCAAERFLPFSFLTFWEGTSEIKWKLNWIGWLRWWRKKRLDDPSGPARGPVQHHCPDFLQERKMSALNDPVWARNHLLFKTRKAGRLARDLMCGLSYLWHGCCIVSLPLYALGLCCSF